MRLALLAAGLVLGVATGATAELRVLAQSGASLAGFTTAEFVRPVAVSKRRTVFRAVRYALTRTAADGTHTVFATGDALPPPLDGTLNAIGGTASNGLGVLAVSTNANSVGAADVIFLVEGDAVTPAVVSPATSDLGLVSLGINGRADLVYWNARAIFSWLHATGVSTQIGTLSPGGRIRHVPPIILDDGEIAWLTEGSRGGVFYWSAERGPLTAFTGDVRRSGRLRKLGLALSPDAGVGFLAGRNTSTYAAVFSPATATTSIAATVGAAVDERQIYRFLELKGFTPDGSVDLFVELRGRHVHPTRIKTEVWAKDGVIVVPPAASPSRAAVTSSEYAVTATQALLAETPDGTTSIVAPGDVLEGAGRVVTVEQHAAAAGVVAFVALVDGGAHVVGRWDAGRITVLERGTTDGQPALAPLEGQLAAGRDAVAYVRDEHVEVRSRGSARRIAFPRGSRFAGPSVIRLELAGRRRVVAHASYQSESCEGIFVERGRTLRPIAFGADTGCGRRARLEDLGDVAADGATILYYASSAEHPSGTLVRRDAGTTFLSIEKRLADGSLYPLVPESVELTGGRALFVASDETSMRVLFEAHADAAVALLREGDATSLGTVRFDTRNVDDDPRVSGADGTVVFSAMLVGGPVRNAIVASDLPE
jgi:hypothetical protein